MMTPSHDAHSAVETSKRDAWFVIRGFYYQVQTTVQRWMCLTAEEVLHCESAEDIEILRTALVEGQLQVERVLEQIKVRETLTLRSGAAISTVVHFFETSAYGDPPTLLRFVTTAVPGHERGLQFPGDLPGMAAWNASRSSELDAAANRVVEQQAHGLFLSARQPEYINDKLWQRFQLHISGLTPEQFGAAFISRIEWATGSDDVPTLRAQLQVDAVSLGLSTEPEAAVLVDVLIAHVFHLLTAPGTKRLVAEDLRRVTAQTLAGRDRLLIDLLETFAQSTFEQLTRIEQTSVQTLGKVDEMNSALQTLLQAVHGARAQPLDLIVRTVDEPPHLPALLTERTRLVEEIESRLQESAVTAVNGAAGMGKTTLAVRVYQRWSGRRHWLSLRGLTRSDIRTHMHAQLALRAGSPRQLEVVEDVVSAYATALDAGLLVIDDLPNLTSDQRLADYVASLAAAVESRSGRILVTTQASIAECLHTAVRRPIRETPVPPMTVDEVRDLMVRAEIFESLQQLPLVESIVGMTSGHPILVAAAVRYMRSHAGLDELRLVALLGGEPVKPVRLRTRQSLRDLLPDEAARELLDRLSLAGGKFTREMVFAAAGVYPDVPRPGELLNELVGVWVTRASTELFELSPLLAGIGVETLAPSTVQQVHGALADTYFDKSTIGPHEAIQVVIHLFGARYWSRLAGFLLQLSGEVKTERQAKAFELLTLIRLPKEVPDSDGIAVLAAQLRFAQLLRSSEVERLEREFRKLATEPSKESLVSAFIGWLFVGPLSSATNVLLAAEGAVRASRFYAEVLQRQPELFEGPVPLSIRPAPLAWAFTARLSNRSDVYKMVDFVCGLADHDLRGTLVNDALAGGVEIFVDRIWAYELDRPAEQRDWSQVLDVFDRLIQKATAAGAWRLLFAAQRAKATVFSDQLSQPAEALALLAIDSRAENNPEELLRRHHLTACVLLDHVGPAASLPEFNQALKIGAEAQPLIYAETARP